MLLTPLAVLLLGQLFILLLVIIFYQRLQKKRLLKDLISKKPVKKSATTKFSFNKQLVTDNLNELARSLPEVNACQAKNFQSLATELGLQLIELNLIDEDEFNLGIDTDELVTQVDIDKAIAQPEPLDELEDVLSLNTNEASNEENIDQLNAILEDGEELDEFDLDAITDLETNSEALDITSEFNLEDDELPEDTLQAALDEAATDGFNELELDLEER